MKNFFSLIRNFKLPSRKETNLAFSSFSKKEWLVFSVFGIVLLISTLLILQSINKSFMVSVPLKGGEISEGIIGTPRFINPVLSFSDVDRDLTTLIYSGLMRKNQDGELIPDLAVAYDISADGLVYTFTLKDNIYFHDDKPVTTDDIIFTINKARDPVIKSPRSGNWDGVSIEILNEREIRFTLKRPYASFLENTTLGILPAHLWEIAPIELSEFNTNPIGSGPYKVSKAAKQSSGVIDSFELSSFKKFSLGEPYIKKITLRFYPNEDSLISALEKKEVDQISSVTPEKAETLKAKQYRTESSVLPRIFGLFFNQNQNQIFTDKNIITAMNQAIDKDNIVREVLKGYGVSIDDPIPPNMIAYQKLSAENKTTRADQIASAESILAKAGWIKNEEGFLEKTTTENKKKVTVPLEFSISTGNAPELAKSAELIAFDLSLLGMKVDVKTFEIGNLNQGVIRPRKYDVLLFGQIINNESDLFAFWHSSQRKDPGLNVAMYTNAKVDKILEDAFVLIDEGQRIKKYSQFENEIKKDMPAVFLYSPDFIYIVSKNLKGLQMDHVTSLQDRFLGVHLWYTKTDNVWKMFTK